MFSRLFSWLRCRQQVPIAHLQRKAQFIRVHPRTSFQRACFFRISLKHRASLCLFWLILLVPAACRLPAEAKDAQKEVVAKAVEYPALRSLPCMRPRVVLRI